MAVLQDLLTLLTASPGSMIYYLVLLFSIWAVVGLALSRWSRGERRGIVPRLLVAGAIISAGLLAFFVVALLDRGSSAGTTNYLILIGPPLERFLSALSLILICWAIVIPTRQSTLGRAFVGSAAFLATALYVISAMQWASLYQTDPTAWYNLTWQPWVWELPQAALAIGALVYLAAVPVPEQGNMMVMMVVLAAGHMLQAIVPFAETIHHFAAWARFAHLLSFPLFAVVAFRLIVQRFDDRATNLQAINQESLSQITGLMDLLDTNYKMSGSLDLEVVLDSAVRSVSQALHADLCGIVLLPQEDSDAAQLAVRYSAPQVTQESTTFQIQEYPAVQHAIARSKPVVLQPNENGHTASVFGLLGSEETGAAIVQPLIHDGQVPGAILVCQPGRSEPFTPSQVHKCETMASHIALAVLNAREYAALRSEARQQMESTEAVKQEFSRTRADLENRLQKAQDEIAMYVQKLYETELAEQRAQNDARELRQELSRAQQTGSPQSEQRLAESIAQIALLNKRAATLDTARSQLEQQVSDLDEERKLLRAQLSKAQTSYTSLRARAQQLQQALANGGQGAPEGLDSVALNSLPYAVLICDTQGKFVYANPVAVERLGYRNGEWRGVNALALWPDAEWQDTVHAVTDQYTSQASLLQPFVVERPDRHMQVTLSPLRVEDQHAGAIVSMHDLQQSDQETRARDEFLSSLAQDLRTPMTSILGYTELLMSESVGRLEGMQRKFLQRVQANIERMGAMLNDLIGVTAIDAGKLDMELEPMDVSRVIESALRKAQFRLEERDLTTHVELGDIAPIHADPDHMQQMVDNLLTNACTCSAAGTTIHILAHEEVDESGRSFLHVAVSDTGGGVAPEDRSRVFERFYRADNALIAGLGETGVGLAIVKALVEAHRGHTWIDTRLGEGTTFHFALPYGLERLQSTERAASGGTGNG